MVEGRCDGTADQARQVIAQHRLPDGIPVWAMDANAELARPGPRLVDGVETLAGILHPEAVPEPRPASATRVR